MDQRGQMTIFIIIAIVIVAAVALFFVFRAGGQDIQVAETSDFHTYVQDCVQQTSEDAVIIIGESGGYYTLSDNILDSFPYLVPVLIDKNSKSVPVKGDLETSINEYIQDELPRCFQDFSSFVEEGFNVEQGELSVDTLIGANKINIDMNVPLVISKEDFAEEYSDFSVVIKPIRIPKLLELVKEIAQEQTSNSQTICVTCLSEKAEEYDVAINVFETDNLNEFVYVISDSLSNVSDTSYNFNFGARYDFPVCETVEGCFDELS